MAASSFQSINVTNQQQDADATGTVRKLRYAVIPTDKGGLAHAKVSDPNYRGGGDRPLLVS